MNPYRSRQRIPPAPTATLFGQSVSAARSGERVPVGDDRQLVLRPIEAGDAPSLIRAFRRLTPEQVRSRVFHALTDLPEPVARAMAEVDADSTIAYVLTDLDGGEIRGEGRVHLDPVTECAEFALAIDPAFTGRGFGRILLSRLVDASRAAGMREIWGDTQAENGAMLSLARGLGFSLQRELADAGLVRLSLPLDPVSGAQANADAA